DCTGSATATTLDQTCTGSSEVFPNCTANFTIVTHATRTGTTYHRVSTVDLSYAGTAVGCDLVPPSCTQYDSWGTYFSPSPAGYCATEVRRFSWGALKTIYR
ncbi:MAG: hypothetical protein ACRDL7_11120, partial [Gaiellaceae bacterium]